MIKLSAITSALLLGMTGCATYHSPVLTRADLQAEVERLKTDNDRLTVANVKCQVKHVQSDLVQEGTDLASSAWDWASSQVEESLKETKTRAFKCWEDVKDKLHNLGEAKEAAAHCWDSP
jgi:FtsZ-binding cell division protein ZapB